MADPVDVFISYSHTDREWAARLAADLRRQQVTVFFDQASLRDGEGWEGQLVEALKTCKHLVCFWSAPAKESEWVLLELAAYRVAKPSGTESGQKLLLVPLDEKRHAFTQIQNIDLPALRTAYAGSKAADPADWGMLVNRIMKVVRANDTDIRIPVAVLTLDEESVASFSAVELEMITKRLGLTAADLKSRYKPRRLDWRPFGGGDTIEEYLKQGRDDINAWLAASPSTANEKIGWEFPDEALFWKDPSYARRFAGGMEGGKGGLIVIDPVATRQPDVYGRLAMFDRCLRFDSVAIVALHPSPATEMDKSFRQWVADNTLALLNPYVFPRPVPDASLSARMGIGVDDMTEVHRILKTSIGEYLRRRPAAVAPAAAAIRN